MALILVKKAMTAISVLSFCSHSSSFSPSILPEQIVRMQLDSFGKNDIETAFSFASPENRLTTGPSWQEFGDMIKSEAVFAPIINHTKSTVLMMVHHDDWGVCCLVRIVPKNDPDKTMEYWWELTKRRKGKQQAGCWMVDSVQPDFEDMSVDMNDIYYEDLD